MIDRFLGDAFGVLSCRIWNIVLQFCARLPINAIIKVLGRAVSGARFLNGGELECDITHHRSVAIICMLYKIGCNPMHPLNGVLTGPYVPVRVTAVHWS